MVEKKEIPYKKITKNFSRILIQEIFGKRNMCTYIYRHM